jgi:hypothetical protein
MNLHVFTVESEPITKFNGVAGTSLINSCKKFGIDLKIFGQGVANFRLSTKVDLVRNFSKSLDDSDLVLFLDFRDTIILDRPENIIEKFLKMDTKLLFGAELFCTPANSLAEHFPKVEHKSKYLNSGLYMGYVKDFNLLLDKAYDIKNDLMSEDLGYMDLLEDSLDENKMFLATGNPPYYHDQTIYQFIFLGEKFDIKLDYENKLFQNVQMATRWDKDKTTLFDLVFDYRNKKVKNELYNTYPSVFHCPGGKKRFLNQLSKMI